MKPTLRTIVAKLPETWQRELRRLHFSRKIRKGRFYSDEPEYSLLPKFIGKGDWVIDVGANVGHYTARLSQLVGITGRVISFEPITETFAVLAWNMQILKCQNVTLLNAGVSDNCRLVGMTMPNFESGMPNFYQAQIAESGDPKQYEALTFTLDQLIPEHRISLVKIDVEGHEASVLRGMSKLLERDHPILILETGSEAVQEQVTRFGYSVKRLEGSPNLLCEFRP